MTKIVSQGAIGFLSQATGTQPVIVIGIAWSLGVSWYSSRASAGYNANIISIGSIKSQKRSDSMCNTTSVNVTFSDTDGAMRSVMDVRNVEKAKAVVYLGFAGGSVNDFVELLRGVTVGPAQWSEGERTVSFDIESVVQSYELGYAATTGDFDDLAESAVGVPWPMIFGSCAHVPALMVREHTVGNLKFPIKLFKSPSWKLLKNGNDIALQPDPDVYSFVANPPTKNKIWVDGGSKFPQNKEVKISILDVIFKGSFSGDEFTVKESNIPRYSNISFGGRPVDPDDHNFRVAWIDENNEVSLVNHHIYLRVAGGNVWYNYVVKQIGNKVWFRYPTVSPVTNKLTLLTGVHKVESAYAISINGMQIDIAGIINQEKEKLAGRLAIAGKDKFGKIKQLLKAKEASNGAWWQAVSDEEVRLWDQEDPDIYIASLIELTEIKCVYGKRRVKTLDGKSKEVFEQIPESYYQKQLQANYKVDGNYPSGVLFYKSLHDYAGQDWTGEIYVSGTSSVGPNSANIIRWILGNYTDLRPDPSFNSVATKVRFQEAHFALFDKRDALRVAQEIAFQSRCGLIMDSERVGIRFLPDQPPSGLIISEHNTVFGTMSRVNTPTSEVVTKLIASWSDTYREKNRLADFRQRKTSSVERAIESMVPSNKRRKTETHYTIYTENVKRFGLHSREEACYIYCEQKNVQKFLDFFGHRFANSWDLVRVNVPLEGALLQVFDGITLNYSDIKLLETTLIPGVVEEIEVNPSNWTCTIMIWLPRHTGSIFQDSKAWPGA